MPFKDTRVLKEYKHAWYQRKKEGLPTRTKKLLTEKERKERNLQVKRKSNKKMRMKKGDFLKKKLGDKCHFCGYNERLTCHRKDGKTHKLFSDMSLGALQKEMKNPDKYIRVCFKCHKAVHWCMKKLNMKWREIQGKFSK
ncbi:MAG: hypothetical protein GOV02_00910 [Candidatus Aenigmarchaeota archaeon]|nr:hypothetical protein [Candidatus Aenigmarchaeota archaeon]